MGLLLFGFCRYWLVSVSSPWYGGSYPPSTMLLCFVLRVGTGPTYFNNENVQCWLQLLISFLLCYIYYKQTAVVVFVKITYYFLCSRACSLGRRGPFTDVDSSKCESCDDAFICIQSISYTKAATQVLFICEIYRFLIESTSQNLF